MGSKNCPLVVAALDDGGGGGGTPITDEVDKADRDDIEATEDLPIRWARTFPPSWLFLSSMAACCLII